MRKLLACLVLLTLPLVAQQPHSAPPKKLVFVCQHGAALSVIAASYFNQMAQQAHLNVHAIARGVTPQENLSVSAMNGLKADGIPVELDKPLPLTPAEAQGAIRIVIFYPIPKSYEQIAPVDDWTDVPPMSNAYPVVRDAILKHLRPLLKELETSAPPK
jgi:hypothetical protein